MAKYTVFFLAGLFLGSSAVASLPENGNGRRLTPLEIELFGMYLNYTQQRKDSQDQQQEEQDQDAQDGDLLVFSDEKELADCLDKHPLTQSRWLKEKGFLKTATSEFKNRELNPMDLDLGFELMLHDNFLDKHQLSDEAWNLIRFNVKNALKDCSKKEKRK